MGNMLVLLVGLLVFSVPGLAVSDTESDGMRLHYEVRVSNPGTHRVHVTLEISDVPEDATLSLFVQSTHATRYATTMCFQSSGCRTEDLGEHISGFVARDSAGRELGVHQILHEDEDGSDYVVDERRITRGGASSIVVEYDAAIVYPTYVHAPELPNWARISTRPTA